MGKLQASVGSPESPPALLSAKASPIPRIPTTINPYCSRSVRATAKCPPIAVYATKTAVAPTIAGSAETPSAAVSTT